MSGDVPDAVALETVAVQVSQLSIEMPIGRINWTAVSKLTSPLPAIVLRELVVRPVFDGPVPRNYRTITRHLNKLAGDLHRNRSNGAHSAGYRRRVHSLIQAKQQFVQFVANQIEEACEYRLTDRGTCSILHVVSLYLIFRCLACYYC